MLCLVISERSLNPSWQTYNDDYEGVKHQALLMGTNLNPLCPVIDHYLVDTRFDFSAEIPHLSLIFSFASCMNYLQ